MASVSSSAKRSAKKRKTSVGNDTCPICLSQITDPTVLSGCFHIFCHECILEWLKLKPQCPLCKRMPKAFRHALRLQHDEKPTWSSLGTVVDVQQMLADLEMSYISERTSHPPDVERHAVTEVINQISKEQRALLSMAVSSYGGEATYNTAATELGKELQQYENLLNMFPIASRRQLFNEPAFRRVLYLRNLSPRSIVPPRFSIAFNLEYIQSHEKSVRNRLLPYIVREVSALIRNECVDFHGMIEKIFQYLLAQLTRLQIVSFLNERGIRHPHQFLNNLYHFGSSGQSLAVYDQNSEYVPRSSNIYGGNFIPGNDDVLFVNSVSNSDVQVVGESSNPVRALHHIASSSHPSLERRMLERRIAELRSRRDRVQQEIINRGFVLPRPARRNGGNNVPPLNDGEVVDLGSSDSDSDVAQVVDDVDDDVDMNAESSNTNIQNAPTRYDNYVYTPTTDAWRRNAP